MTKNYVLIENGRVAQQFQYTDAEIAEFGDIQARFHPDLVKKCIDTTGLFFQPPVGWLYDEKTGTFVLPLAQDGITALAPRVYGAQGPTEINGGTPLK